MFRKINQPIAIDISKMHIARIIEATAFCNCSAAAGAIPIGEIHIDPILSAQLYQIGTPIAIYIGKLDLPGTVPTTTAKANSIFIRTVTFG